MGTKFCGIICCSIYILDYLLHHYPFIFWFQCAYTQIKVPEAAIHEVWGVTLWSHVLPVSLYTCRDGLMGLPRACSSPKRKGQVPRIQHTHSRSKNTVELVFCYPTNFLIGWCQQGHVFDPGRTEYLVTTREKDRWGNRGLHWGHYHCSPER